MKKALLLVLGIIAVCFLLANIDYLAEFASTLQTGALIPIIISIILMLARHFVQAASYDAAFDAVGHRTGFWHNVVLIFSLVFINTFCLFSGATGVASSMMNATPVAPLNRQNVLMNTSEKMSTTLCQKPVRCPTASKAAS